MKCDVCESIFTEARHVRVLESKYGKYTVCRACMIAETRKSQEIVQTKLKTIPKTPAVLSVLREGKATINDIKLKPDGSVRTHSLAGGYPIIYVSPHGVFCPECAMLLEEEFKEDPEVNEIPELLGSAIFDGFADCLVCEKIIWGAFTPAEYWGVYDDV